MARFFRLHLLLLMACASVTIGTACAVTLAAITVGVGAALATLATFGMATLAAVGWGVAARASRRAAELERALVASRENIAAAALRDPLTGLGNFRLFDIALRAGFARAQRYGQPLSVLLIEAAVHGHARGDERSTAQERLLKFLGVVLQTNLREADCPARLGDVMFGVVLSDTDHEGAQNAWERLRAIALSHWPGERSWSVSGGTAGYGVDVGKVEELLAEADRRLALEKRRLRAEPET